MAQKPFETLDLTGKYIVHDVPLYCHGHPTEPDGMNAGVKEIETQLQVFDLENYPLSDGVNTVTAAELRDHLDNHPLLSSVVEVTSSRAVLASEFNDCLLWTQGAYTLTLPDVTTLSGDARVTITKKSSALTLTITPYTNDRIFLDGIPLVDGTGIESVGTNHVSITLRKFPDGWIAVSVVGTWQEVGGGG